MNILYAWEWGSGLSHLLRFQPLARRLRDEGHNLLVASRDLSHVRRVYPRSLARIVQAPTFTGKLGDWMQCPQTVAGLAWNLGYNSVDRIAAQVEVFRELMTAADVDVVISDFGLSASIAAATLGLKRIRIGTGYECPPLCDPLAAMQYADQPRSGGVESKELQVLQLVNRALETLDIQPFDQFRTLIGDPGHTILATIPEVDPYREVEGREYLGVWQHPSGTAPDWPVASGARVFAYLKPFPALPKLLELLAKLRCSVALVSDGIPTAMLTSGGDCVRLQQGPVDLKLAAEQCNFAITNSTHSTTVLMLSLGVPVLGFPVFAEQRIIARSLQAQRLALHMNPRSDEHYLEAVMRAQSEAAQRAVSAFAERVSPSLERSEERAATRLLSLL